MTEQGYRRLTPHYHPEAVTWWFFRSFDDGFSFAAGGRVRTARAARKALDGAYDQSDREHHVFLGRPTHRLMPDGSLEEIIYPDRWPLSVTA